MSVARGLVRYGLAAAWCGVVFLGMTSQATTASNSAAESPPLPFEQLFDGDFSLVDHHNVRRTKADYRGYFVIIYFGYTYCPDICPTSIDYMMGAVDKLDDDAGKVQPIFITIDPERDTPDVLEEYVSNYGDALVGLTGTESEVRSAAKAFRIHRRKVVPEWAEGTGDYLVDHSSNFLLFGPDGKFLTLFPHRTPADVMTMRMRKYISPGAVN